MSVEQDLKKMAQESYYMTPEMIKFLLVENLALKTLLHEKGVLDPNEFREQRQKAQEILEAKAEEQLKNHLRNLSQGIREEEARRTSSPAPD